MQFNFKIFTIVFLCYVPQLIFSQEKKQIDYKSDILEVNETRGPEVKILKGNVQFYHQGATMYCDSALYNTAQNSFKAYSEIIVEKPLEEDTVYLFGDSLTYSGTEKIAKVRSNVVLRKDSLRLSTQNLDFNLIDDVAYYFDGGVTENGADTLKSKFGYYYSRKDEFFFKDSVKILNPKYVISSDTLMHNTKSKITYFYGPTTIVSDSNLIYCENGWYNHNTDIAQFKKNSYLKSSATYLKGDSLFYDRKNKFGKALGNVKIIDTVQNAILQGYLGYYDELKQKSMITEQALFVQVTGNNDSLFLHADTLLAQIDTIVEPDTTYSYRIIKAYPHVKIYKSDFQAKCDSMVYSFRDSTIELRKQPVIWSKENQLSAELITIQMKNNELDMIFLKKSAFIVSKADSIRFNQIKGLNMIGYMKERKLYKVDVIQNSETLYFPYDKDLLIGVNKIESGKMTIILNNNTLDKIWFYTMPTGKLYPPDELPLDELYLKDFAWFDAQRPKSKMDVFIWHKTEAVNAKSLLSNLKKEGQNKTPKDNLQKSNNGTQKPNNNSENE